MAAFCFLLIGFLKAQSDMEEPRNWRTPPLSHKEIPQKHILGHFIFKDANVVYIPRRIPHLQSVYVSFSFWENSSKPACLEDGAV